MRVDFIIFFFHTAHKIFGVFAESTKVQTAAVIHDSLVFAKSILTALVGLSPPSPPVRRKNNSSLPKNAANLAFHAKLFLTTDFYDNFNVLIFCKVIMNAINQSKMYLLLKKIKMKTIGKIISVYRLS